MGDGIKYDQGKPRPDLVLGDLMDAIMVVINIGSFGAYKYAPSNFLKLDDAEKRFADAALRHYCKRKQGEIFDDETGEYHLGHEIWDKLAELLFYIREHKGIEYVLTIRNSCDRYYDPDGLGGRKPYFFDEEEGRQMIWKLMDEGVKDIKVDKKPIGDDDIWYIVSSEEEARIEAALPAGWPTPSQILKNIDTRGATIPQDGTSGLSVGIGKHEEGPFGVFNTSLNNWLIRRNEWSSKPEKAKHFTYRSDAVVAIQDQLGFADAQVCEVREIPNPLEIDPTRKKVESIIGRPSGNAYGIWDVRNCMWLQLSTESGTRKRFESWTNHEERAGRFSKEAAINVLATKPFDVARNLKMRKLQ